MDVSSIAALATDLATARTQQAASIAVLKMAMQQQSASTQALVDAASASTAQVASAIENLGQNIDVYV